MAKKMQAAIVEQFGKPLVFQDWDIPTPAPGQIVVKTAVSAFATFERMAKTSGDQAMAEAMTSLLNQLASQIVKTLALPQFGLSKIK
jgi:Zn-dependent alcohol dehydrogenase